jgi:hypothetical protein
MLVTSIEPPFYDSDIINEASLKKCKEELRK